MPVFLIKTRQAEYRYRTYEVEAEDRDQAEELWLDGKARFLDEVWQRSEMEDLGEIEEIEE